MPFSRPVAAPAFQSRRVRREDAPGAPVLTGRCIVEDSMHPTTAQTEAASGWTEQHNTSGGGGRLQLAVEARQRQAAADGQLQIGGVIGGKLIVSGQLNDVGKGPVAGFPIEDDRQGFEQHEEAAAAGLVQPLPALARRLSKNSSFFAVSPC